MHDVPDPVLATVGRGGEVLDVIGEGVAFCLAELQGVAASAGVVGTGDRGGSTVAVEGAGFERWVLAWVLAHGIARADCAVAAVVAGEVTDGVDEKPGLEIGVGDVGDSEIEIDVFCRGREGELKFGPLCVASGIERAETKSVHAVAYCDCGSRVVADCYGIVIVELGAKVASRDFIGLEAITNIDAFGEGIKFEGVTGGLHAGSVCGENEVEIFTLLQASFLDMVGDCSAYPASH